jgi:hypothetical protein
MSPPVRVKIGAGKYELKAIGDELALPKKN